AGDITKCVLERVNAAQAGVLELRHLELPREPRSPEGLEGPVHHAPDDDRSGGVVGARLSAESQKAHLPGVDVVVQDQTQDGIRRHRVDVLVRSGDAKTAADDLLNLRPGIARPGAPSLERYPRSGYVEAHAADPCCILIDRMNSAHSFFSLSS